MVHDLRQNQSKGPVAQWSEQGTHKKAVCGFAAFRGISKAAAILRASTCTRAEERIFSRVDRAASRVLHSFLHTRKELRIPCSKVIGQRRSGSQMCVVQERVQVDVPFCSIFSRVPDCSTAGMRHSRHRGKLGNKYEKGASGANHGKGSTKGKRLFETSGRREGERPLVNRLDLLPKRFLSLRAVSPFVSFSME